MNMVASPEAAVYYPTTLAAGDKLAPCQDEPQSLSPRQREPRDGVVSGLRHCRFLSSLHWRSFCKLVCRRGGSCGRCRLPFLQA